MSQRAASGLSWRKSTFVIALATVILLAAASSAMAAGLGLWGGKSAFGDRSGLLVEPIDAPGSPSTLIVRVPDATVDSGSPVDNSVLDNSRFDDD